MFILPIVITLPGPRTTFCLSTSGQSALFFLNTNIYVIRSQVVHGPIMSISFMINPPVIALIKWQTAVVESAGLCLVVGDLSVIFQMEAGIV